MSIDPINFVLSIFSGIGNKLFDKKDKVPNVTIENYIQVSEVAQTNTLVETTEVAGIVRRLNEFLKLLNVNTNPQYTIAKLAKIMNLQSVGELENIFTGKSEPNFEFIEKFCDTFSLNEEWLVEGKRTPFYSDKETKFSPIYYYSYIQEVKPIKIYFIRAENSETSGYTFIILKFSDWKYEIIRRLWHIGSGTGSGGESQIYGMYQLFKKLDEDKKIYRSGRILDKTTFDLLYSGKVFPKTILENPYQNNMWWDDFTDVNNRYFSAETYKNKYGFGFVVAQNVVKVFLEQENK